MTSTLALIRGSFSPPHIGHLLMGISILQFGLADRVWYVPSLRHAHGKHIAPYDLRCQLVGRMAAYIRNTSIKLSQLEQWYARAHPEDTGPIYTIDLLRWYRDIRTGSPRLRLVVGADCVLDGEAGKWKGWEEIVRDFDPIIVGRQGVDFPRPVHIPPLPGSSTEVRRLLAAKEDICDVGDDIAHLVPASIRDGVLAYRKAFLGLEASS